MYVLIILKMTDMFEIYRKADENYVYKTMKHNIIYKKYHVSKTFFILLNIE